MVLSQCLLSSLISVITGRSNGRSPIISMWKLKAPSRVIVFGWLVLRKRILTMDNLRRRRMVVVNGCPMCFSKEETVNHLLLNCKVAHLLWRSVMDCFGCSWVFPNCIVELFQAWRSPVRSHRGKEMWGLTLSCNHLDNLRRFEGKSNNVASLIEKIKLLVASWVMIYQHFKPFLVDQIMHNWVKVIFSQVPSLSIVGWFLSSFFSCWFVAFYVLSVWVLDVPSVFLSLWGCFSFWCQLVNIELLYCLPLMKVTMKKKI